MNVTAKSNLPIGDENIVNVKVFGVGGAGNNAINRMAEVGIDAATLVAVNTDIPVLRRSKANEIIAIGETTTRGRGAGANPEIGREAAEESKEIIKSSLADADMLYITAGMGGGTGTGAAPVIAKIAKELNILTIAVVTRPFAFEGTQRMAVAEDGIERLKQYVDALIVISNEKLREITTNGAPISFKNAFAEADNVLIRSVKSICDLISTESYVNLDFADLNTVLRDSGDAHIGIGVASGADKAQKAAEQALTSPLLDSSINSAAGVIISIKADEEVQLEEITQATQMITSKIPDAKIIWGIDFDPQLKDSIQVVVIATKMSQAAREAFILEKSRYSSSDVMSAGKTVKTEQSIDSEDDPIEGDVVVNSDENKNIVETKADSSNKCDDVKSTISLNENGEVADDDELFSPEEYRLLQKVVNNSSKKKAR